MKYKYYTALYCLIGMAIIIYIFKTQFLQENYENNNTIPLIIHQIWVNGELYPKMKECIDKLKMDNPEFEHNLYDDAKCRAFISENYDKNVLCAYDKLIPYAFQADLVRYCVLYKKGGIYLDIKYQMENGNKLINYVDKEYYTIEHLSKEYIYNGFIISKPNNPLWLKCINKIVNNVNNKWYGDTSVAPTGPALVYNFFDKSKTSEIIFKYDEKNGKGFIKNEKTGVIIMSHYPEYREEQKQNLTLPYWKDLWANKNIYKDGVCKI